MKYGEKSIVAQNMGNRPIIIGSFLSGTITAAQAAHTLQLSRPHIYALAHKARREGLDCLLALKKRGTPPKRFSQAFENDIVNIYAKYEELCSTQWKIIRPTFTQFKKDILSALYNITISYSSVHKILTKYGIRSPKKHRIKNERPEHPYRPRTAREGSLWLTDGSSYHWFGGNEQQCLHIVQDDATGKVVGLFMSDNECFFGYAEAFKRALLRFGIPERLLSDRASVFYTTQKQKDILSKDEQLQGISEKKTQMAYILSNRIGIDMRPCFTPESKGRVERIGQTLQSRLPLLFKLHDIYDIDSANKFLIEYIDIYNKEFEEEPIDKKSAYVPLAADDDLTQLFSIRHTRRTDSVGVISFHNYKFKVLGDIQNIRLKKVRLYLNQEWGMKVKIGRRLYDVELLQLDKNKKARGANRLSVPIVWQNLFNKYLLLDAKNASPLHLTG